MPSVDVKNELRGSDETANKMAPKPPVAQSPLNSIQIQADDDLQVTLVEIVMDDYDKAKSDRNKKDYGITSKGEKLNFDEWFKRIKDMYNGNRIPKTIPWKFCSNRSVRIATSVLDLLHARLFPAVWNEDLARWRPGNYVDVPKAERISKFMDWWVRVHNPLRPFFDLWVKYATGIGDALTETSWEVEEIATSEKVDVPISDESGQPVLNQDGTPALMPTTKINRIETTKSRVITKDNVYLQENARDIQRDPVVIEEIFLYKQLEDMEKMGVCVNVTEKLQKFIIVPEVQGNLEPDEKDRIRKIKLRNMPVKVIREYLHYDTDGSGVNDSLRVMISSEHRVYLGGVQMRNITKSGKRPIDFTKYDNYLDRPDDLDGEGVLHKVRELSEEIDACFNQLTDAHTLAVLRPFFYDPSGDIDAPALNLGPNKGIPVSDPQKNVMIPDFNIQTERLINAIRLVMEFIERLTAASSYMMGKESEIVGGSGTATRTQAIVQSAEVRFTLPSERLRFGASRILNQHLDLLQLNIQPGLEEKVLGESGEKIFLAGELTDQGIAGEYIAFLLSDPSMGSKETERQLMGMIYSILMQNIIVGTDPAKIYAVTSDFLKAYGKDEGFVQKYLGPPPMQDDITDPEQENTLMLRGDYQRVVPQMAENHMFHIMKHMDLPKSPNFQALMATAPSLTQEILEYNQNHIALHMQMMQQMMSMMQKGVGKGGAESGGADKSAGGDEPEADGSKPGVENTPGPMGKALDTQRTGKSGQPANI